MAIEVILRQYVEHLGQRGEVVKVASVSGNTVTVTTALHDTYDPVNNLAQAQRILNPLTGATGQFCPARQFMKAYLPAMDV